MSRVSERRDRVPESLRRDRATSPEGTVTQPEQGATREEATSTRPLRLLGICNGYDRGGLVLSRPRPEHKYQIATDIFSSPCHRA